MLGAAANCQSARSVSRHEILERFLHGHEGVKRRVGAGHIAARSGSLAIAQLHADGGQAQHVGGTSDIVGFLRQFRRLQRPRVPEKAAELPGQLLELHPKNVGAKELFQFVKRCLRRAPCRVWLPVGHLRITPIGVQPVYAGSPECRHATGGTGQTLCSLLERCTDQMAENDTSRMMSQARPVRKADGATARPVGGRHGLTRRGARPKRGQHPGRPVFFRSLAKRQGSPPVSALRPRGRFSFRGPGVWK